MNNIDPVAIGVVVTVLLWLLGLSFGAGRLSERVANLRESHDTWRTESREDLKQIYERLEEIVAQNGGNRNHR